MTSVAHIDGPVPEVRARGRNAPLLLRLFLGGLGRRRLADIDSVERWASAAAEAVPPGTVLRVCGHSAELLAKPRRSRGLSTPPVPSFADFSTAVLWTPSSSGPQKALQ